MQSHKNQIHRLLLIDRVLQSNTFNKPDGATRESIEQSVRELLNSDEAQFLTPLPFEALWKGKDAFRKDLKFILTHYPGIMQKQGNKLWSYQSRGMSIFPRFGGNIAHQAVQDGILLLEYYRNHPMSHGFDTQQIITILKKWSGMTVASNSRQNSSPTYKHQFSLEDAETLTSANAMTLYDCCEANSRRIVNVRYTSARTGEERELEFHPWQFVQSEGRWYISGYISKDLMGNYPNRERSNFPGLVLKLDEVKSVSIIPEQELAARKKNKSFRDIRHTYQPHSNYPSLLRLENRIGIGGWDRTLGLNLQQSESFIKFKLHQTAIPYFKSSGLYSYTKSDPENSNDEWTGFKIKVCPTKRIQPFEGINVINRETIALLRAFGPQLKVTGPKQLLSIFQNEADQTHLLYNQF